MTRSTEIRDYKTEIEKIKATQSFLDECQKEYEQFTTYFNSSVDVNINPKALKQDLASLKHQFSIIEINYLRLLSEQIFLQHLKGDPDKNSIDPNELNQLEKRTSELEYSLTKFTKQSEELISKITHLADILLELRTKWLPVMEESSLLVQQIDIILEELQRIQTASALVSNNNIEQTKEILQQQIEELTRLHTLVEETQDEITEEQWCIEDLENEIEAENTLNEMPEETAPKCQLSDEQIDSKFKWHKEQYEKILKVNGVKDIEFEANSSINITLAEPYNVKLYFTYDKNRITNVTISGMDLDFKKIDYVMRPAMETNLINGVSMLTIEIMSLLKSKA